MIVVEIPFKHAPKRDNLDKIDNLDIVFLWSWIVIGGPLIATKKERSRLTETPQQSDVSTISTQIVIHETPPLRGDKLLPRLGNTRALDARLWAKVPFSVSTLPNLPVLPRSSENTGTARKQDSAGDTWAIRSLN